jgi:hypothetical protein
VRVLLTVECNGLCAKPPMQAAASLESTKTQKTSTHTVREVHDYCGKMDKCSDWEGMGGTAVFMY